MSVLTVLSVFARSSHVVAAVAVAVCVEEIPVPARNEPIYQASNRTLFHDGFEEFTSSQQLTTYGSLKPHRYNISANTAPHISLRASGGVGGGKAVRFTYPPTTNNTQQNLLLEAGEMTDRSDPSEVVLTFWIRTEPGMTWYSGRGAGGVGHKIFILNGGNEGGGGTRILLQFAADGIEPADLLACNRNMAARGTPTWSIAGALYKQNLNYPAWDVLQHANDGQWHRYTTRFRKSTRRPDPDHGDGRIEMWVDGTKVMEYLGDDPRRCEYNKVNVPTVRLAPDLHFPSVNGAVNPSQWLEYDEVRLWTP